MTFTSGILALLFAFVPVLSFAKDDKADKPDMPKQADCLTAFGHLIAPGWIKNNGPITLSASSTCFLPFGISKKFKSVPPDTIAPFISALSVEAIDAHNAMVTWKTNEKADSAVYFGTSLPVNVSSSSTNVVMKKDFTKDHHIALHNLLASTTYYIVVRTADKAGHATLSGSVSFTTKSDVVPDITAPVISNVIVVVSSSTMQVGWMTNEPATSKVFYSLTSPVNILSSSTPFVENASLVSSHLISVLGLTANTKYYLVVQSKDASGNAQMTSEFSLTTGM